MVTAHVDTLQARHAILDKQLNAEMLRPVPDSVAITRLKREKLKLKEQIQLLHS